MLLEARDLYVSYGDIRAVSGVSFRVKKGELVSIIGANGAGKTSIMGALMGIVPLEGGSISYNERNISDLPAHRRARAGIRMVPERARVFARLSVHENLMTGIYGLKKQLPWEDRICWLYDLFPMLKQRRDQPAATLSGGEQQQLAIARALISDPQLLLVDEVSMGLMPKLVDHVFELLEELNRRQGLTILLVEQNALASLEISQRAYVLETGVCVAEGDTGKLRHDPRIREVYLGSREKAENNGGCRTHYDVNPEKRRTYP